MNKPEMEAILDIDPGGLAVVTGSDLHFVYANPAYRSICPDLGIDPIGQPYAQIWSAEAETGYHDQIAEVARTGESFQIDTFSRTYRDGAAHTFTLQARPIDWDEQPAALIVLWETTNISRITDALRASQKREHARIAELEALMEAVPALVWIAHDPESRVITGNRFSSEFLQMQPGKNLSKTAAVEEIPQHFCAMRSGREIPPDELPVQMAAARGTPVRDYEFSLVFNDGETRHLFGNAAPLLDENGKPAGAVSAFVDITDRKQTEARLELLSQLIELSYEPILTWELDGAITTWNRGCEQLYGFTREEAIGQSSHTLLHTQHPLPLATIKQKLLQDGHWTGELRHRTKQGQAVIVESRHQLVQIGDRRLVLETNRDITERKANEESLAIEKEWFRTTLSSIGDAVVTTDEHGLVTFLNPVAEQLTGWSASEASHKPLSTVLPMVNERTRVPVDNPAEKVLEAGVILGLANHTALITRDGKTIPIEDSAAPIKDAAGQVRGIVLVFHDVTEKHRQESDLQQLNRTLKALGKSGQAMLRAQDEQAYMADVCRIITQDCGHAMVWIGFAEHDEARSIRPAAYAGFDESYLETLQLTWAETERGRGPAGTAIRTGKPNLCRNILTDPQFAPWRAEALQRGYASSISLPLLQGGQAFGVLAIYSHDPDPFSEREIELLTELANDLAYGITSLRQRQARAQAEEALKASEAQYRSLFNEMTDGFALHEIVCDEHGRPCDYRFLSVNPAFERLTGLKREDVEGKLKSEVLELQEDDPTWVEIYGKVALTGEPAHFETYAPRLGRYFELLSYQPAANQFAVLFVDVTDRKHTETLLNRYRLLSEHTRDIILFVRLDDGQIIEANRAAEKTYGYSRDELLRLNIRELRASHSRREVAEQMKIANARGLLFETWHQRKNGTLLPVEVSSLGAMIDGQKVNLSIVRDVTERRALEQRAREDIARLEVQRRLIEQREQERAQIARDLHDGPVQDLTGATFTLQLMADSVQDEQLSAGLIELREALQKLIAELRAYAGELRPPALSKFGLEKAIQSHAEQFREKHPKIRLSLEMHQVGDLLPEPIRIAFYRIYQESLNNVLKHAHASQIAVRFIKTEQQALLEIHDNGRGFEISQDWLELARQGHLGLVGMRERAEALGGSLEIQSAPDQGTNLRVTVPL